MLWKRGLLLAAINLAIAMPIVLFIQARTEKYAREHPRFEPPPSLQPDIPEPHAVTFTGDPCAMIIDYPPRDVVVRITNLPSAWIIGWRLECRARWSMSSRLGINYGWTPTSAELPTALARMRIVDTTFLILIPIQWFLMGAFPLVRPKHWYFEPGMFITLRAAVGALLSLFPSKASRNSPPPSQAPCGSSGSAGSFGNQSDSSGVRPPG